MAAEPSSTPVNGNHTPHQGYGSIEQSNGTTMPAESSSTAPPTSASGTSDIPKDEVGWYFVEQYYTTLSRSPEKLYVSCVSLPTCLHCSHHTSSFTTSDHNSSSARKLTRCPFVSVNG